MKENFDLTLKILGLIITPETIFLPGFQMFRLDLIDRKF